MPREMIVRPKPPVSEEGQQYHGLHVGWNRAGWVQVSVVPHGAEHTGQWHIVDMDRDAINRMIKALRKARTQAYGRDE